MFTAAAASAQTFAHSAVDDSKKARDPDPENMNFISNMTLCLRWFASSIFLLINVIVFNLCNSVHAFSRPSTSNKVCNVAIPDLILQ